MTTPMPSPTSQAAEFFAYACWHRSIDADWVSTELTAVLNEADFKPSGMLDRDLGEVKQVVNQCWNPAVVVSNREAAVALVRYALEQYRPSRLDAAAYIDLSRLSPEAFLAKASGTHLATFRRLGLRSANPPGAILVDEYPPPYDRLTGTAIAPDRTDQSRYGFQNAIYFRRARYTPVIASLTLAHEFVHTFIDDEEELARGLEEGLADYLAYFVIAPKTLSHNILSNHYSTRRISYGRTSQRFNLYAEYMRRVHALYRYYGLAFLINAMQRGRRHIKTLETHLNSEAWRSLKLLPNRSLDRYVELGLAEDLCSLSLQAEVYSPRALLYCLERSGAIATRVEPSAVPEILDELQKRTFVVLTGEDSSVEFADFSAPAKCRWARFDPHT